MLVVPHSFGPILDAAGAGARREWDAFKAWTEKTVSGPGDLKAAARADRFLDSAAMVDAVIAAFAQWTPPGAPRELKTIQYAMYLALRSGRADAAMLAYLNRVVASETLGDDDKRREVFSVSRYLRWAGTNDNSSLSRALRRLFDGEAFQNDETLVWARGLGLAVADDEPWRAAMTLEARPGGQGAGEMNVATLILIAPYPSYRDGAHGWTALLWGDFNHPKEGRDFRDVELHWRHGEPVEAQRRAEELAELFGADRLPKLSRLADFPDFVREIEEVLTTRFDNARAGVKGLTPKDRKRVKRWLAGKAKPILARTDLTPAAQARPV